MAVRFGTSGVRGPVTELTPACVADYVAAFLRVCAPGAAVSLGWDLRPSSPAISAVVAATAQAMGRSVDLCGVVPTPALALAAQADGRAAVMVTGSHIPADRNGIKFYRPDGEISKADEARITAALTGGAAQLGDLPPVSADPGAALRARSLYLARYCDGFGPEALAGLRVGLWQHSSAARVLLLELLTALGAEVVPLGWSDSFVPVDTEAVAGSVRDQLSGWAAQHQLDAIVSTDGDGDRPMVADGDGRIVPGDGLGVLTARALGARRLCTPVSSNTQADLMTDFDMVRRTRIGSPHVIAAMEAERAARPAARVIGYEANGGVLLGFTARGPVGEIPPLMTRDSALPIVAVLAAARAEPGGVAGAVAGLPARFTAAGVIRGAGRARAAEVLDDLAGSEAARARFLAPFGRALGVDLTDGVRMRLEGGAILHLRQSGNAPEVRVYADADSRDAAATLMDTAQARLSDWLG